MATSLFTTDGGSFDLASLSVGSMVGMLHLQLVHLLMLQIYLLPI